MFASVVGFTTLINPIEYAAHRLVGHISRATKVRENAEFKTEFFLAAIVQHHVSQLAEQIPLLITRFESNRRKLVDEVPKVVRIITSPVKTFVCLLDGFEPHVAQIFQPRLTCRLRRQEKNYQRHRCQPNHRSQ